jgi:hypothetical protein
MTTLDPAHLRDIRSFDDVIGYLADELDWPIGADDLEDATFDWDPDELGLPAERVPHFVSLRQLRPLEGNQPWGIFFLEFDGPRLPLTALRRLLDRLVTKKRASGSGTLRTWKLDDLLFIITTSTGDTVELHFVAFFEQQATQAEIRSIPWRPNQSPAQHLKRLATELLPHLAWPDDPSKADEWRVNWRAAFKLRHGEAIASAIRLAERMADTAQGLRREVGAALAAELPDGPFTTLMSEVREQLVAGVTPTSFADMCAQTLVYGVLTSRVTDPASFGASPTLAAVPLSNPFLAAFFDDVHDQASALDLEGIGLEQLVADLRESNVEAILDQFGASARGGDPVIHFYEEFLERYDRKMRADAGAFYTPQPVVEFMTRTVDVILRERLHLAAGLADGATWAEVANRNGFAVPGEVDPQSPFVAMIDPATGTGTFLVEWLRQARMSYLERGTASDWPTHAQQVVLPSLHAFELMLGPYAIAHLKVALELNVEGIVDASPAILLTDTLGRGSHRQVLFDADPVSQEGERADALKERARFTVCIGNPPYLRADRDSTGGWVVQGEEGGAPPIFEDILRPARENTAFGHLRSLSNLYVYFWRWALWKTLEADDGPGVVAFITASSWLTGPGFMGLRQLVRQLGSEVIVVDLGGDNRGARPEENVFDIQTAVAIVFVVRAGQADSSRPAAVSYTRVTGTRAGKLNALKHLDVVEPLSATPLDPSGWLAPLSPVSGGAEWAEFPALFDLLPWQQPGCLASRTWPIAPSPSVLKRRWKAFVAIADLDQRAGAFRTARTGRNIHTKVPGMPRLADLDSASSPEPIARYGYRSFDRQWIFEDTRLLKTEAPTLWASRSERQIFMSTLSTAVLGIGPGASLSTCVPDYHNFRGSYGGKDVIPLYRDPLGTPNADPALLEVLGRSLAAHEQPTAEDLFAYCYFILAGADYTVRFSGELNTPGPRVPMTADPERFGEAVALGRELIWLHTYGERFARGRSRDVLLVKDVSVAVALTLPDGPNQIGYEPSTSILTVGHGEVIGVSPEVWDFELSGMQVVRKWLGYRTEKGTGRAAGSASPLDQIRPTKWEDEWTNELLELVSVLQRTVDLQPEGVELLDLIVAGPLISADELPDAPLALRQPPALRRGLAQRDVGLWSRSNP